MNVFKLVLFYRVFLEFVVIINLFPIHVTLLNLDFSTSVYFPIGLVNNAKWKYYPLVFLNTNNCTGQQFVKLDDVSRDARIIYNFILK